MLPGLFLLQIRYRSKCICIDNVNSQRSTVVTNTQPFIVGDSSQPATYRLNGGVHSFGNSLCISTNSQLTGCGTVQGVVVNNGTIATDCSLTFNGPVTNNSTIVATGYGVLVFSNQVVNNGTIDASTGTLLQFAGGLINNGTVKPVSAPQLTIIRSGANVISTWPANYAGFTLQSTTNLVASTVWSTHLPAPVVVNGQNAVTNPITGSQQFCRLSK